ncbi:MAG TPA: alpha/beta hydrolase [Azospirillum sp.]
MRSGLTLAAGILAGLWLDTARRSARAEREHPPTGGFVNADGVHLHVLEQGQGAPVVFVHGAGAWAEDFAIAGLLDRAGERWRAIAIDRPGCGYSDRPRGVGSPQAQAEILHAGLVTLNASRPILVGHSFGGAVVLAYALQYPEEVGGVVFISGYAFPTPRADFVPFMVPAIPGVGPVLSRTVAQPIDRALLPALLKHVFAPNPVPDAYWDQADMLLRPGQLEASAGDIAALIPAARAMSDRYGEIRCPLAILAGDEDRILDPQAHAVRLHDAVPGSTLHLLAGAGHMAHHARPEAVMAAIERVMRAAQIEHAYEQAAS